MNFVVFRYGGRPVIAVPLDGSLRVLRSSIACLPSFTFKRKVFKLFALVWGSAIWVGRRLGLVGGIGLDSADQALVERIKGFCPEAVSVVPIWSLVPDRPRSYFRVFDAAARELAFAKVSTAEPGRTRLQVEARALQAYEDAETFDCPHLLKLDVTDDAVVLITTALPRGSQLLHAEVNTFPKAIHAEIRYRVISSTMATVRKTEWYRRGIEANLDNPRVMMDLRAINAAELVSLAPVHGDFGSENFFADPAGRVFLVDWEHHSLEAPVLTDEVGFWIGRHHRAVQRGQSEVAKDFALAFRSKPTKDILLALVYLSAFDVTDAKRLAALWKN